MKQLALAFGWAWGLPDWRIGEAIGLSEYAVMTWRRAMGLRKTGRGAPVCDFAVFLECDAVDWPQARKIVAPAPVGGGRREVEDFPMCRMDLANMPGAAPCGKRSFAHLTARRRAWL